MIDWAVTGVMKLAQEVDPSFTDKSSSLLGQLELIKNQHSESWVRTFAERLYYTVNQYPREDWHIALSEFQLRSKLRCQDMLNPYCDNNTVICYQGSWLGLGPLMLLSQHTNASIAAFDIDNNSNTVSNFLCRDWDYHAYPQNVLNLSRDYNMYVNLITEHLDDITEWRKTLPPGATVLASNTDIPDADHYSTCNSLEEFIDQLGVLVPLSTDTVTCYRADGSAMNRWIVLFTS